MAANLESMFYVNNIVNADGVRERWTPWHGLGTPVENALGSKEALEMAGLDWEVKSADLFAEGLKVPNYVANVRTSDNAILGVVTKRYQIVQNKDAFGFTDALLGEGAAYETAGSLSGGKRIWLLAKMDSKNILGDAVDPYICFTNSHDGSGAVQVCMTPTRVCCNNTLNIALNNAKRKWSTRHIGDLASKMEEAKNTLQMAATYMQKLDEEADKLANNKISDDEIVKVVDAVFPTVSEADTDRKKENVNKAKEDFYICYFAPDIKQFRNTQWGVVNAMADFVSHNKPQRASSTYAEKNWGKIIDGHPLMDKLMAELAMLQHNN